MTLAIILFVVGVFLSAFFSGVETGFYRVTRVRLVIDALGGNRIARGLLWATNHPSVFVATSLIGNNIANYLVSLGIVIGVSWLLPTGGYWTTLLAPILLSPIVFVYGESMPKTLFYESPNSLLRLCGPALLVATILFSPVIAVLWVISRGLEWLVGESPQKLRLGLARRELAQVLDEGHEAGILLPSQKALAQGLIDFANRSVGEFATPVAKVAHASPTMNKEELLRLAKRQHLATLPVLESDGRQRVLGYLQVIDLYLDETEKIPLPKPMVDVRESDHFLDALMRLQKESAGLGRVIDNEGKTLGYVTVRQLSKALFRGHGQ